MKKEKEKPSLEDFIHKQKTHQDKLLAEGFAEIRKSMRSRGHSDEEIDAEFKESVDKTFMEKQKEYESVIEEKAEKELKIIDTLSDKDKEVANAIDSIGRELPDTDDPLPQKVLEFIKESDPIDKKMGHGIDALVKMFELAEQSPAYKNSTASEKEAWKTDKPRTIAALTKVKADILTLKENIKTTRDLKNYLEASKRSTILFDKALSGGMKGVIRFKKEELRERINFTLESMKAQVMNAAKKLDEVD